MLQTLRNLQKSEILWTRPGSRDAGFERGCSRYKSHLGLHSKRFLESVAKRARHMRGNPCLTVFVFGTPKVLVNSIAPPFSIELHFVATKLVIYRPVTRILRGGLLTGPK